MFALVTASVIHQGYWTMDWHWVNHYRGVRQSKTSGIYMNERRRVLALTGLYLFIYFKSFCWHQHYVNVLTLCLTVVLGLLHSFTTHYITLYFKLAGTFYILIMTSHERNGVSNYRQCDCLFNRLFRPIPITPALLVLCGKNPSFTDGFPI